MYCILWISPQVLHHDILLYLLEEKLNIPPMMVEISSLKGAGLKVVGDKIRIITCYGVMISNHPDRFWVEFLVSVVLLYQIVNLIVWYEVDDMSKEIFADVHNLAVSAAKLLNQFQIGEKTKILVIY